MTRTAVLTDATSAEFWFPKWYDYYGKLFGWSNLYVVTYEGKRHAFDKFELGGVRETSNTYSEAERVQIVAALIEELLQSYQTVVRCDVDEFIVPDRRRFSSLREYVEQLDQPYVTAFGIDVFEGAGDAPLAMNRPIVHEQRRLGVVNTSLHKTAVTRVPIRWAPGFHAANVQPSFNSLFMLHTKFADIQNRTSWFQFMKGKFPADSSEFKYFSFTAEQFIQHKSWLTKKQCVNDGWSVISGNRATSAFLRSVSKGPTGIYQGDFVTGDQSFILPEEFRGIF